MSGKLTIQLINSYIADIQIFMKLFEKKYGRSDVMRAWRDGTISQFGSVTDSIEYELHGIGCCIFFPDREVDFDFAPERRTDGFDLWRLTRYLNHYSDFKKDLNEKILETSFKHLLEIGVIKKLYPNSNLYFLDSKINSNNKFE